MLVTNTMAISPVLNLRQVLAYTTLSKTLIYKLIKQGKFPPGRKLGGIERVVWLLSEVDEWVQQATNKIDLSLLTTQHTSATPNLNGGV